MDSFMVKEMNLKLSKRFPTLSKTILYEKSNMNELADYLCEIIVLISWIQLREKK